MGLEVCDRICLVKYGVGIRNTVPNSEGIIILVPSKRLDDRHLHISIPTYECHGPGNAILIRSFVMAAQYDVIYRSHA